MANRLNPFELHQKLINEYVLRRPGDTSKLHQRDTSKDKTDYDVIRENHRFLWDDDGVDEADTWEKQLAKRYYDKLFKEYCVADLSRYKENKIALRWRIDREVVTGKGQFICGNKVCSQMQQLKSWEVNFAYVEHNQRKNALVKLRLCPECSDKLNYHSKKREVKRLKNNAKKLKRAKKQVKQDFNDDEVSDGMASTSSASQSKCDRLEPADGSDDGDVERSDGQTEPVEKQLEKVCWTKSTNQEEKTREEEFDEYLADLLL